MKKFTLLELLIVIAIIGILVSILMPSLNKAREKAKRAVCKSNQAQIGRAINVFAKTQKGRVPIGNWSSYQGNYFMKVNSYYPLLGSLYKTETVTAQDIFYCPSRSERPEDYDFTADSIVRSTYMTRPFLADTDIVWVNKTLPLMINELPFLSKFNGDEAVLTEKMVLYQHTSIIHEGDGANILSIDGAVAWNPFSSWTDPFRPVTSRDVAHDANLKDFWEEMDEL